jgi:ribonuclease BN (tRNA processing enzyme)
VRITVLGKSPAWQDAGGACTGYLVQEGDMTLLLDCGSGVFGKLRAYVDYVEVDAVLVTHLHADHFLDLVPYASALTYAPRQQPVPVPPWPGTDHPARPALHAPPGAREAFAGVCGASGMRAPHIENAFAIREYDPSETLELGPLRIRFCPVPHFIPTNAVELVSARGGGRITFSADTAPSDALCDFAAGTDLLLIEAALPRPERSGPRGHLTPAEAGAHGARARARRLVLTHISDELDPEWAVEEGSRAFGGPVEIAREGAVYEL